MARLLLLATMILCSASHVAHALTLTQVATLTAPVDQLISSYLNLSFLSSITALSAGQGLYVQLTSSGASSITSGCTNSPFCLTGTSNSTFVVTVATQPLGSGVALTVFSVCALVTDSAGLSKLSAAQLPITCSDNALTALSSTATKSPSLAGSVALLATSAGSTYPNNGLVPAGSTSAYPSGGLYFVVLNAGTDSSVKPLFQVTDLRIQITPSSSTVPASPQASPSPGHAAATRPSCLLSALALLAALMFSRM